MAPLYSPRCAGGRHVPSCCCVSTGELLCVAEAWLDGTAQGLGGGIHDKRGVGEGALELLTVGDDAGLGRELFPQIAVVVAHRVLRVFELIAGQDRYYVLVRPHRHIGPPRG